ncbi:hypothetical protein M3Y98_00441500 [Aphelenchoides besseyi]|nr:hypothetical protein M3Y98_00441500 [Aphelenchoides besseyi]KAI6202548.1 hypothetical protein M3Y96_00960500 [Aphelenchoides besseyi]
MSFIAVNTFFILLFTTTTNAANYTASLWKLDLNAINQNDTNNQATLAKKSIRLWPTDPLLQYILIFLIVCLLLFVCVFILYIIVGLIDPNYLVKLTKHHQYFQESTPTNNPCEVLLYWCYCCFVCGINNLLIIAALKLVSLCRTTEISEETQRKDLEI